jgi:uncharacterized protein (DUF1697 family)
MASRSAVAYVALLRGINVGGKNALAMKDLARLFTEAGCTDVSTYIQSGNVICKTSASAARDLPTRIHRAIEGHSGLRVPVVLRTAKELAATTQSNPFLKGAGDAELLHVAFLADAPDAARLKTLDPLRSAPDEFVVIGRDVFLRLPNGVARSKLTNAYFDSKLATTSTLRNWRTVLKLLELAQRLEA